MIKAENLLFFWEQDLPRRFTGEKFAASLLPRSSHRDSR
jgi:hypothetical protein